MARATLNDLRFVAQAFSSPKELCLQVVQVGAADVAQLDTLEIIPDALIRIEIWGIARQLLQMQAFGGPSLEKVFERVRPVDGRAVPDEDDLARNLA